jgi:hypothetical protein
MAEAFGADAPGILFLGLVFREISVEGRFYSGREILSTRFLKNLICVSSRLARVGWLPNASRRIGRVGPDVSGHAVLET